LYTEKMSVVSRLLSVTAVVLFTETSLAKTVVWLDTNSNGRRWNGKMWSHEPAHGDTNDCVCIKAVSKKTKRPEVMHCWTKGYDKKFGSKQFGYTCWGCGNGDANIMDEIDMNQRIDITTFGTDALWIDRMFVETVPNNQGWWSRMWNYDPRIYGKENTAGWCLSKDKNDVNFDKWATVPAGECFTTLSLKNNKHVDGYHNEFGFYSDPALHRRAKAACAAHDRISRRRVEIGLPEAAVQQMESGVQQMEANVDSVNVSPEIKALHATIKALVRERDAVDSEEIEEALEDAMLALEHEAEHEAHDGEVDVVVQ